MPLPLLGRRVHISGSISKHPTIAAREDVEASREFVRELVVALLRDGATFVVPVDAEPVRDADDLPFCFDWLVLETIEENLRLSPAAVRATGEPLVIAVQHHKNVAQIPPHREQLWERLNEPGDLLVVENAGHWNMNSKRLEIQSRHGDILIALGGEEGVLHLANLYHGEGKPVIPLPFPIHGERCGALRLWDEALISTQTHRFFSTADGYSPHHLLNRLNFAPNKSTKERVEAMQFVLHALRKPRVFAVRLLNPKHEEFQAVEEFFDSVVKPVVEELGYELKTMDGRESEDSVINIEIFRNLHYSSVVVADTTGERPNCFIELGYALGQGYPVMLCSRERKPDEKRVERPFDISPVPSHSWSMDKTPDERRREFRDYWKANIRRRPIVEASPLVP